MINIQLKFEGKILQESHKILSFKANFTLKVQVKVISFQTNLRHLDAWQTVQVGRKNLDK